MEGCFINKSLLALGSVINKLSEGGAQHIPFRDSKLTRLLQDSLTGRGAHVAVICTVTPASSQAEETHSTLKFAARAKKVGLQFGSLGTREYVCVLGGCARVSGMGVGRWLDVV